MEADKVAAEKLCEAADCGDAAAVDALLAAGADANAGTWCTKPLFSGAVRGHTGIVEALLRQGAEVDARDSAGFTPLSRAAFVGTGEVDVVRLLLDRGADVNAATQSGQTVLHHAVQRGDVEVVRLLLERGTDVGATTGPERDNSCLAGCQPLHVAARCSAGSADLIQLLLAHGADVHASGTWDSLERVDSMTPLHFAAGAPAPEAFDSNAAAVCALLDAGAHVAAAASDGRQALHFAAESSDPLTVALLLARGADVAAVDRRGATPLHVACTRLHDDPEPAADCANLLLEAGADASATLTSNGRTPLHVAAHYTTDGDASVGVLLALIRAGADARAADSDGQTALHFACSTSERLLPDQAMQLLAHGADACAADTDGWQPLHALAKRGCLPEEEDDADEEGCTLVDEMIWLLRRAGADVNAVDRKGRTPLMLAAANDDAAMCAALRRCGAGEREREEEPAAERPRSASGAASASASD